MLYRPQHLFLSILVAGCAQDFNRYEYLSGPSIDLQNASIQEYAANEAAVVRNLAELAGVEFNQIRGQSNERWKEIAQAGINYVDVECARYIDSIFWYNRARTTATSQISLAGAATGGILGVAEAAADTIAITALSFGLVGASVDNIANSVLYQLNPSAVQELLEAAQREYFEEFTNNSYTTRQGAMAAIRGYLALCLPASLETRVNSAVSNARIAADVTRDETTGMPVANSPPRISVIPSGTSDVRRFELRITEPVQEIRTLLDSNQVTYDDLRQCMTAAGLPEQTLFTDFLLGDSDDLERQQNVATCLREL